MRYYEYMLDMSKHEGIKEGDKVKVVGNFLEGRWDTDHVGFVYAHSLDGCLYKVSDTDGKQTDRNWYRYEDLELVEQEPSQGDNVNHPSHYGQGKIEAIEYIEDFLTKEEYIGYLRGNIAKYMHRWRYKNGIEDLEKAQWYLTKLIGVMRDD